MTSGTKRRDAVIVGGGHNGLVCAWYLASAGLNVTVCEARPIVGGAAVTEEFHPGFRNSVASYTVSLLNPTRDRRHGPARPRPAHRRAADRQLPAPRRRPLPETGRRAATHAGGIRQILGAATPRPCRPTTPCSTKSATCCATWPSKPRPISATVCRVCCGAWRDGRRLASLSLARKADLLDLFTESASTFLDGWFESEPVKAAFGFDAVVGNYASPDSPGSAYVLLHHTFGEVNGKKGAWGHAIGGMGAITQAMAKACAALGVEILTQRAGSRRCWSTAGKAAGVELAGGARIAARIVASNVNPVAVVPESGRARRSTGRISRPHGALSQRLGHLPDECRFVGVAGLYLPARQDTGGASPERHHHRAIPRLTWTRPGATRKHSAGRASRSSRC